MEVTSTVSATLRTVCVWSVNVGVSVWVCLCGRVCVGVWTPTVVLRVSVTNCNISMTSCV